MIDDTDRVGGPVRLTGRLICGSAREAELVRRHLPEHLRLTRAEPGCVSFDVSRTADPLVWRVEECFVDRAAFEAHRRRTRASDWWGATAEIRRDYRIAGPD
ncbi:MAG: antibiotic biosynthesis monooxygenase [Rhodovulum sulfidophilum]|uniref:Antibiotic biosynthesis monooxygenase n=1 Tax=Rhodovulum sulfidophilum TaxID=35806 RepID=A0A2W5NLJ7_RHOSU|nr:MAG: antibiotic biosynthesis monooxygenase [Rhodovulum sulfidophilum]